MSNERRVLQQRLPKGPTSPAIRQFRELLSEAGPKVSPEGATQSAYDALTTWAVRLWNLTMKGRRVVGLADLVRELRKLPPDEPVEQFAVSDGLKTGLIFFARSRPLPVGAIVSVRTEADVQRSQDNWRRANGELPPQKLVARETDVPFVGVNVEGGRKIASHR